MPSTAAQAVCRRCIRPPFSNKLPKAFAHLVARPHANDVDAALQHRVLCIKLVPPWGQQYHIPVARQLQRLRWRMSNGWALSQDAERSATCIATHCLTTSTASALMVHRWSANSRVIGSHIISSLQLRPCPPNHPSTSAGAALIPCASISPCSPRHQQQQHQQQSHTCSKLL